MNILTSPRGRGLLGASGGGGGPFAWSSIPNQVIRINSTEGSLAFSGGTLTGVTDVSAAAETVTVGGTPTYTAANASLNGQPSFKITSFSSSHKVEAPNIVRADIKFVAAVFQPWSATNRTIFDANAADADRHYLAYSSTDAITGTHMTNTVAGIAGFSRVRMLAPFTALPRALKVNGVDYTGGTGSDPSGSAGTGIVIGDNYSHGGYHSDIAFFMALSAQPSGADLAAIEAQLIVEFG